MFLLELVNWWNCCSTWWSKFYFTAPCKNSPTNYQTGNIAGENCARFTALAIVPGGDKQTHGSWAMIQSLFGNLKCINHGWNFGSN